MKVGWQLTKSLQQLINMHAYFLAHPVYACSWHLILAKLLTRHLMVKK